MNSRANRIKLIRNINGNQEVYLIDLSTIDGIKDGSIILQSNDIIYVEYDDSQIISRYVAR